MPVASPVVDNRMKLLDAAMKRHQHQSAALIEVLHTAQELFGSLSPELLTYVGRALKLPLSRVYGVATFYHFFSLTPKGAHTCVVCMGTACYVKGAAGLLGALEESLDLKPGQTRADGKVSLMTARCLGACGLAPVVVFDNVLAGSQSAEQAIAKVTPWLDVARND